jgi:ABC-type polysaccharide/polyol phosphate transport system ATPase subunit
MSADIAIKVENLTKVYKLYNTPTDRLKEALSPIRRKYHHDFNALHDVSFEVKKGEAVGIIGRNGSGKSTLLKIITGVLTPTSGSVTVNGRISALLELGSGFNPELTGIENIYFNGTLMGISREEMESRLDAILAFADIGEFVHQPVKSYSSGMFVRLAFAVAVCVEPEILIVDEALSVGDMAFQQKCLERLRLLREKGVTILLVTHDIMLTRNYCEYVVYLKRGNVAMVADAETAGEAYIKDARSEMQKLVPSPEKPGVNNASMRYGSSEGEITAVEVQAKDSDLPVCVENEQLIIRIFARIEKSIMYPAIHVQVRDFRGYILYGIYTQPHELEWLEHDEYIELRAALSLNVNLQPGEYGVAVSLNNAHGELMQIILDKHVSAATFTVLPKTGGRVFNGVINLNGVWAEPVNPVQVTLKEVPEELVFGKHDIGDLKLEREIRNSEFPEILQSLVDLSRKNFGFFNKTISRSVEYPYISVKIGDIAGKHILDVGAGVSPLPLYLALSGATVVTVDNSETVRQLHSDKHDWNGWGFFDYGALHNGIASHNKDITEVTFAADTFDCVYSVSVLEHMSAQSRRDMWHRVNAWLKGSGLLILTLDLIPKTELLWNFSEGRLVEASDEHGDIKAVQDELAKEGFALEDCKVLRMPPESMTDIALLSFRKNAAKAMGALR